MTFVVILLFNIVILYGIVYTQRSHMGAAIYIVSYCITLYSLEWQHTYINETLLIRLLKNTWINNTDPLIIILAVKD